MSTPAADTKVFVHDSMIFSLPNTTFLPVIPPKPLPDPDYIDPMSYVHPREMCAMQWSYNAFPYLAYIPVQKIDFRFEGFMSLNLIEIGLQCISQALFLASGFWLLLYFDFFPSPTSKGYLWTHRSPELAEKQALISRDAFVPLMAMCSMAITLYSFTPLGGLPKLHWLEYLTKTMKPPPHPVWLRNIEQSPIARLDLLYPQAGVIIDVVSCQYLNWVSIMMAHNIPIWFYWGKVDSPLANPARKDICAHQPTPEQIRSAHNAGTLPMDAEAVALVRKEQRPDPKSCQRPGETWQDFFIRQEQRNAKIEACEDEKAKQARLQRQANAGHPGRRGAHVYVWMDVDGFLVRTRLTHGEVDDWWDNFKTTQQHYNGFADKWDLCEDFDLSTLVCTWEYHTEPLVHFQLAPEDTLVSIYNRLGISMPDVDLSNYKGLLDNDLSWERTQIYLALDGGEIEDMYHIPVQDFVFRLLGGNCPVSLFWDLSSSHPFPLNPNHRMFRVAIWRVRGKEKPLYVLHPLTPIPEGREWILSVNNAATILETLRHEFSSRDAVARYYISRAFLSRR
ncbi:hypothetical protein K439DRAFT_1624325 [Ramaria rubella]|nr:hypothetical protein K439DRAFT_1624325 [Ramaria rubella]